MSSNDFGALGSTRRSPSRWTAAHLATIAAAPLPELPMLGAAAVGARDLWDFWPVTTQDGAVARIADGELWFALSAPATGDPVERHARARLRLLHGEGETWADLGDALPDGFSPGSREWSGSAIVDAGVLTLYFTAAGRRGEVWTTFEQRLFETRTRLDGARPGEWSVPVESVASDGRDYLVVDQAQGAVGTIKAFRDPGYFRDPGTQAEYLLFAASLARSASAFNGAVGAARRERGAWGLLPPLITADGLNNELERPHVVVHGERYYLFWSTQASVFAPGVEAPTGLYGMVANAFAGPYRPLNGSGLVLANPAAAPGQQYSWLVLGDLRVASFVDQWGPPGRAGFGGVRAPDARLVLDGDRAQLAAAV